MSERIQVVDLRPGDTIIVSFDGFLSKTQREDLRASCEKRFPENKVVVCEGGMQITVARPGANEMLERTALAVEKLAAQFDAVIAGDQSLFVGKD